MNRRNFLKSAAVVPVAGAIVLVSGGAKSEIQIPSKKGHVLHVECGIEGSWEPTTDEMNHIADLFNKASNEPHGGIVVTRNGVKAYNVEM